MGSEPRAADVVRAQRRAAEEPGPGDHTPKHPKRVDVSNVGGGRFNAGGGKSDVEWQIHRASSIPGPGDHTPNDPSRDLGTGFAVRFSSFHPKNYLEQHIYDSNNTTTMGPGEGQPELGFSSLTKSGGKFSDALVKTDIEWDMLRASEIPAPGDCQPAGGFSTLDRRGGRFNAGGGKTDVELEILRAAKLPAPTDTCPAGGFSTLDRRGGKFNESKAKTYREWIEYYAEGTPGPADTGGAVRGAIPSSKNAGAVAQAAAVSARQALAERRARAHAHASRKTEGECLRKALSYGRSIELSGDKTGSRWADSML
jgi:hypothetical protein